MGPPGLEPPSLSEDIVIDVRDSEPPPSRPLPTLPGAGEPLFPLGSRYTIPFPFEPQEDAPPPSSVRPPLGAPRVAEPLASGPRAAAPSQPAIPEASAAADLAEAPEAPVDSLDVIEVEDDLEILEVIPAPKRAPPLPPRPAPRPLPASPVEPPAAAAASNAPATPPTSPALQPPAPPALPPAAAVAAAPPASADPAELGAPPGGDELRHTLPFPSSDVQLESSPGSVRRPPPAETLAASARQTLIGNPLLAVAEARARVPTVAPVVADAPHTEDTPAGLAAAPDVETAAPAPTPAAPDIEPAAPAPTAAAPDVEPAAPAPTTPAAPDIEPAAPAPTAAAPDVEPAAPAPTPAAPAPVVTPDLLGALVSDLGSEAASAVAASAAIVEFPATSPVFTRDEPADGLYVVLSGRLRVDGVTLEAGALVGAEAILAGALRAHDAQPIGDLATLVRIPRTALEGLSKTYPEVELAVRRHLERNLIDRLLASSPLFSVFDPDTQRQFLELFELRSVTADETLEQRGQRADALWILLVGQLTLEDEGGSLTSVPVRGIVGAGAVLGAPAPATLRSTRPGLVLRLGARRFGRLMLEYPPALAHLSELT